MIYLARRFGFYVVTAWAAITINFFIPRLMPGNPVELLLSRLSQAGPVTPGMRNALAVAFGLNTHSSLLTQYFQYWGQLFHGNLGTSITYYPSSVASVIASALPWTIGLVGTATVIAFVLGTVIGTIAAWRRGSFLDVALPATAFLQALPYFWVGLVAIELFSIKLGWFPLSGGYDAGLSTNLSGAFLGSASVHALLPAFTVVITSMAGWMVGQRNVMITTLDQDYVLVAQAKGVSQRRVMISYAARNAILPNFASFAQALGFVVSGALLVELVFSYPGIGYVLLNAVNNEDFPMMEAIFLIIVLAVLAANFIADLVYVVLDPRARQEA
ncbi:MAG TPA: ABC transporter permease [Streptosporangiaceae bacterium]|jgi:peptide/nickel transport system permease protein